MRHLIASFYFLMIFGISMGAYGLSMAPPPPGIDQNMASAGKQGLILSGKIVSAEPTTLPNGWQVTQCTFEGEVIKGNNQYPASSKKQTIVFKTAAGRIRGLLNCRAGMEGVFSVYGEGSFGTTSFVNNGAANITMEKGADGKLYSTRKNFSFQNKNLATKFSQANPGLARKALATGSAAPEAESGLTMEQATDLARYLAKELYPDQAQ